MRYDATVVGLDDSLEELVVLDVLRERLTCFGSVCPYPINIGETYPVEFHIHTFDELEFEQIENGSPDLIILIDGFRYSVSGKLNAGGIISNGIVFQDDDDFSEIAYLDGKRVKVSVDRLDVHFCE